MRVVYFDSHYGASSARLLLNTQERTTNSISKMYFIEAINERNFLQSRLVLQSAVQIIKSGMSVCRHATKVD